MDRSRRVTLYSIALAGALLFLAGIGVAGWRMGHETVVAGPGETLAAVAVPWLVIAGLGFAVWLAGWVVVRRVTRPLTMAGAAERAAQPRKAALALIQLAAVLVGALLAWTALRNLLLVFLAGQDALDGTALLWIGPAVAAALVLLFWGYHEYEATRDEDLGPERAAAARWRRGYVYAVIFVGSLLTIAGSGELLRASIGLALRPLAGDTAWQRPASGALAALLVGILLGSVAWGRANRAMTKSPAVEANAPSRVLVRHAGILFGAVVTLVSLGYLIQQVLLRAVSREDALAGQHALLGLFDWTWALAYLPVAALVWISASRGARSDARMGGENRRTGTARRFVRYLIAGLALAAFWYGLVEFAWLILQVLLGAGNVAGSVATGWLQRFATAAALLLVGAPAWWAHWWSQQVRARAEGSHGQAERSSKVRRAYLILIVLVGGALVVAAAGFGAFLFMNWQAASQLGGVRAAVAGALAAALVSFFWTLTHGLTLRGDARRLALAAASKPHAPAAVAPAIAVAAAGQEQLEHEVVESPAPGARRYSREELAALALVPADSAALTPGVAIIDGGDGGMGVALIDALREAAPHVRLWPIGLNSAAEAAMVAALGKEVPSELPQDLLSRVAAILLPTDALTGGELDAQAAAELNAALVSSPSAVILLPPSNTRFKWVAAPDWPRGKWVENAVIEVMNVLDGTDYDA